MNKMFNPSNEKIPPHRRVRAFSLYTFLAIGIGSVVVSHGILQSFVSHQFWNNARRVEVAVTNMVPRRCKGHVYKGRNYYTCYEYTLTPVDNSTQIIPFWDKAIITRYSISQTTTILVHSLLYPQIAPDSWFYVWIRPLTLLTAGILTISAALYEIPFRKKLRETQENLEQRGIVIDAPITAILDLTEVEDRKKYLAKEFTIEYTGPDKKDYEYTFTYPTKFWFEKKIANDREEKGYIRILVDPHNPDVFETLD